MYVEKVADGGVTALGERRDVRQSDSRTLGRVVQCSGSRATIAAVSSVEGKDEAGLWAVGRLISISLPGARTVGLVYDVAIEGSWNAQGVNAMLVQVELIGEVRDDSAGLPKFDRGIADYPFIGAVAHRIRQRDLEAVYRLDGSDTVAIGTLSQDPSVGAHISMNRTLDRHFAVVGSTGVGKSTAVSLLLHKAIEARPALRILILDPHNEFAKAFPGQCAILDSDTLELPFWMFRLEELVEVIYRGREGVPEEIDLLRDMIPQAKQDYKGAVGHLLRRTSDTLSITADTPVPYRMADLMRIIDDRMGLLDSKHDRPFYRSLRQRLEAAVRDPRFRFMFGARIIEDNIADAIGRIFRVPANGKPITCFQMAGMPSEVVNSVCSVLARLAFDLTLWGKGRIELLLLCEEAHRYMPADQRLGFAPTRHALARIAKEGRKYGCYLGVVTQRPGELDPTILSQCSTVFAMRLSNDQDQAIIRSAISDSSASTLSFLSSMGQREAIAFGDGVATPMRLKFETLAPDLIPASITRDQIAAATGDGSDVDLVAIVELLRNGGREADKDEFGAFVPTGVVEQRKSVAVDPEPAAPPTFRRGTFETLRR
ncbi:MAG: ATP-binding protein [Mesorhizobium sp.]|nr:ATP-binding protein [Mesorhizobium sp.]